MTMPKTPTGLTLLLTSAALAACSAPSQPSTAPAVTVDVWINNQGPYPFGTDTGASGQVYLHPDLAQTLDLPVIDTIQASDGNSDRAQTLDVVRLDAFEAAGVRATGVAAPVIGFGPGSPDTRGFVGFEYFRNHLLTIDLAKGALSTSQGSLPPRGKRILPYTADRGTPHIPITLAGVDLHAHLDTGADGPLLLPREWIDKLPLKSEPALIGRMATLFGEEDLYEATLDGDLVIGPLRKRNPIIRFSDLLGFPNIGRDVLAGCRLTFDQKNRLMRIDPPAR